MHNAVCTKFKLIFIDLVEEKSYIIKMSMKYDVCSTPSMKICWNFNFSELFLTFLILPIFFFINIQLAWIPPLIAWSGGLYLSQRALFFSYREQSKVPDIWYSFSRGITFYNTGARYSGAPYFKGQCHAIWTSRFFQNLTHLAPDYYPEVFSQRYLQVLKNFAELLTLRSQTPQRQCHRRVQNRVKL